MKLRTRRQAVQADPTNGTDGSTYPTEPATDDHAMRACGETCARCNATFQPDDEVRRNVAGDCVHLDC